MSKFSIEEQMPFYEAFFGQRVAISHIKHIQSDFTKMIKTLTADLKHYHKDVDSEKLREAILVALKVLHRLDAKHPNVYTKVAEFGLKAFKHADRFLQGKPLPLPPIQDEEELWDIEQGRKQDRYKKTQDLIASMTPPEMTEERKKAAEQGFENLRDILNRKILEGEIIDGDVSDGKVLDGEVLNGNKEHVVNP